MTDYTCSLCPRNCSAIRTESEGSGFCHMEMLPVVARIAPHMWEEPFISGTRGSGTVFFAGCNLGCAYCQNYHISHQMHGRRMTVHELTDRIAELESRGVHNISFVTGTHFIPAILESLNLRRPGVPVVWNSGGYETVSAIRSLEGRVQIYLPDLKNMSPMLSKSLLSARDYFAHASAAILEMIRQTGTPVYDRNGILQSGTVIRHLVLPGCTSDSLKVLQWIHENTPAETPVSIMRQYTPIPECNIRGLDRRITDEEYDRVVSYAADLKLNALTQEKESAETQYIPDFDLE